MFCKMFFFLHKFISREFFTLPEGFKLNKILITARTPTEIKQNLLQ